MFHPFARGRLPCADYSDYFPPLGMRYHEQASFLSIPFELHVYSFPLRAGLPFAGRDREKIFRARPSRLLVDYPPTAPYAPSRHRRPPDPRWEGSENPEGRHSRTHSPADLSNVEDPHGSHEAHKDLARRG